MGDAMIRSMAGSLKILLLLTMLIFLSACSKQNEDGATRAIEAYIQALSNKDSNQISNLSCTDWEQNALVELDSLTSVGSKVENMKCEKSGQDGDNVFVSCTGAIALDYDGEIQKIDLANRTYIAKIEGGDWRMCGYR